MQNTLKNTTYLDKDRHLNRLLWQNIDDTEDEDELLQWRMVERMKTVSVALVLCLNIGTDPPDVVKTEPCARRECWLNPFAAPAHKSLELIGKALQSQYERWQPRARYRQLLDPKAEDTKKLALGLRRQAKNDRVLWHYNGHGVPRPTPNGEIWVFNKNFTQYIPLSIHDLQIQLGTPSIYVFDCSAASTLLRHFYPLTPIIVLAACGPNEILPMNPEFPADIFTSCLTTPITIALRWFISQNQMSMSHLDASFIDRIPGRLNDRKTPLGELNWIFTAITDTIAWNCLSEGLFQRLFRQDLLVASLFRNFLLAERIMTKMGCTPATLPVIPSTRTHALWESWDLAVETCLNQLWRILNPKPGIEVTFQPCPFFTDQLTAFEVWLQLGSKDSPPPEQLPIVLQVLLSQIHRLRALVLLRQFLDLGPWAVNLALSVGIFPYILKLLQSPAAELKQTLVFIWARVIVVDISVQKDLIKDDGQFYFMKFLQDQNSVVPKDQKVTAAFVLAVMCESFRPAQENCLQNELHLTCVNLLMSEDADLRRWLCFCLANLWQDYAEAQEEARKENIPAILLNVLSTDPTPEVRAAAVYALGCIMDSKLAKDVVKLCRKDLSPMVRREGHFAVSTVQDTIDPLLNVVVEEGVTSSTLYKWSKKTFGQAVQVDEDPLSETGAARRARYRRNESVKSKAKDLSDTTALHQNLILDNQAEMSSLLLFHPFEPTLVVADEKETVSVLNYEEGECYLRFQNQTTASNSRLTCLRWLNEEDESLLLCGSDNGMINIWDNLYDFSRPNPDPPKLVTSFFGIQDLVSGTQGSGLVSTFDQATGRLLCGGNATYLNIFDLTHEQCVGTIATGTDACLTSLQTDTSTHVTIAGCGDGSIRAYDTRMHRPGVIATFCEHEAWVVNAHIRKSTSTFISGSMSGDVKVWDLRQSKASIKTIQAQPSMTTLVVHDYAPLFASGSHEQQIKVFNIMGDHSSVIRYHDGFLGERIGPISSLAFHPYRVVLAAGATDSLVGIYTSD